METITKIKIDKITVTRAEGPSNLCGKKRVYATLREASLGLAMANSTYPKDGTYDKHDFVITFADGETYSGRLDVKHSSREDNDQDIRLHVLNFAGFHAGTHRPAWMTPEKYQEVLTMYGEETKREYAEFLNKYDFGCY